MCYSEQLSFKENPPSLILSVCALYVHKGCMCAQDTTSIVQINERKLNILKVDFLLSFDRTSLQFLILSRFAHAGPKKLRRYIRFLFV